MSPYAALHGAARPALGARTGAVQRLAAVVFAAAMLLSVLPAYAVVPPELPPELASRAVRHPALDVRSEPVAASALAAGAAGVLDTLGVAPHAAHLDLATGRWGSLLPAVPMVPGNGNRLSWSDLGTAPPESDGEIGAAAWSALEEWITRHAAALGIDPAELAPPAVTVHDAGALIQVSGRRIVAGVPVRDCTFTAAIAHGNLVLFGTRNWGDVDVPTLPALAPTDAEAAVAAHLGSLFTGVAGRPHLELVPVSIAGGRESGPEGRRVGYRLAWVVRPELRADLPGEWEALIDAASGEVLSFADTVHYLGAGTPSARQVIGGRLPRSSDGVPPGGVEEAGAPVPYADLEDDLGVVRFADGGGNLLQCLDGTVTTRLQGRLVEIQDDCGPIEESTAGAVLDLGTNAGTDCATPPGASAGNTRAARTAYYELSRMKEIALGQLPDNAWLNQPLPVETNVDLICGAAWNGTVVRAFRQSGSQCINSGEVASVLDHEWGHGMDQLGANPGVSNPSEGIADLYAALRTHESCIGPNFLPTPCGGYGDPCTVCQGVRDIDWEQRVSGQPHDLAWIDSNCFSGGPTGPCDGGVHCEGAVYSEAIWDLYRRDLQGFGGSAFDLEDDTAAEIVTRLTFLGGGLVGGWFDCAAGAAGCAADTGYMNFLAADDDDGDLTNGTPHMSAIFAAFDRHGIACATPAVVDSGCTGTPTEVPVVSVTPADRAVRLSWDPIAGASGYDVFRTEGPFACDEGKVRLGGTVGTEWIDRGLQNGRTYRYLVIPKGPAPSCFGNGSACTPATPAAGGHVTVAADGVLTPLTGDGDAFVDNCELTSVTLDLANVGSGSETGVQVLGLTSPSHPDTEILDPLPIGVPGTFGACAPTAGVSIEILPRGMAHGETLILEVLVQSAGMPFPSRTAIAIDGVESDTGQMPDTQPDLCEPIFADGFESGDTSAWTSSTP